MTVSYFFSTANTDNTTYLAPATGAAGNHVTTLNSGISTNVTYDTFELRVSTGVSGAQVPTKLEVMKFLDLCKLWLFDHAQGLDALLTANSASTDIP